MLNDFERAYELAKTKWMDEVKLEDDKRFFDFINQFLLSDEGRIELQLRLGGK